MIKWFALSILTGALLAGQTAAQFGGTFDTLRPEQKRCLTD